MIGQAKLHNKLCVKQADINYVPNKLICKLFIKRKTREDPSGNISNLPGLGFKGQAGLNLTSMMPEKKDKC